MASVTPFLWFDGQAEEAANYYLSVFPDASLTSIHRYGPEGPGPEGSVLTVNFKLCGQPFVALNAGPQFTFTPALSLFIDCDSQEQADQLFDTLAAEGQTMACGWVTDKFGVTWQIVPPGLLELITAEDPGRRSRAMRAMMDQIRLDVAVIRRAADAAD